MIKKTYYNSVISLLDEQFEKNGDSISNLEKDIKNCIKTDSIIHIFGTGHSHMIGLELWTRAGGLANINAIMDPDSVNFFGAKRGSKIERISGIAQVIFEDNVINPEDIVIVISNSGLNSLPIEFAQICKKNGNKVYGITSLTQSNANTARHATGEKLKDVVDIIIDNGVPSGDGLLTLQDGRVTGGFSTIFGMFLLQNCVTNALEELDSNGESIKIYTSQNTDGYDNDKLFEMYKERVGKI